MPVKIHQFSIENVKRVKAVALKPSENGLTVIGGDNGQGKTSVLDAIAWALGGDKYKPSQPQRDGSVLPPDISLRMSNGIEVTRKGKNSALKVSAPDGGKSGQQLLNDFVEQLALDLPKFLQSNNKEKANTLLRVIGVEQELRALETEENRIYQERLIVGRTSDQKAKYAKEQTFYPGMPAAPVSAYELIQQQQAILTRNAENQRLRQQRDVLNMELTEVQRRIAEMQERERRIKQQLDVAEKSALDLLDESTEDLERNIESIDEINRKVRANLDKEKAEEDARQYADEYQKLSMQLDAVRSKKTSLLNTAQLPLPGLTVEDGELMYNGFAWDNLSGADQLRVATAIVRKINPNCGFVLLDKLEQMDSKTLADFGQWLEQEGLQAIATRVSTGGECAIIIEDGYAVEPPSKAESKWKAGEF